MASPDQIRAVMAQIGERLDCQAVTEFEQRKSWIVVVDDSTVVEIAFDDKIGLLHVTSPVGDLPQPRRLAFCELLLRHSDQWLSTGGLRMGLAAESDRLSLTYSAPSENLEPTVLVRQLQNFVRSTNDWRRLIDAWTSTATEENSAARAAAVGAFEYVIRV